MNHTIWRAVEAPQGTFTGVLNAGFSRLDAKYEGCLPDLRSAKTLLLGSDYSGESVGASYFVYSFLVTSLESWSKWETQRLQVRRENLSDSRRMSFKRLADIQRRRALAPLLDAANSLDGLSFSVAWNKKCESAFASPPLDLNNPEFSPFRKWKPTVLEKAFFVIHVLGVMLAGLSAPGQNVLWFTDEDSIAANDDRVRDLTQLFVWISSQYLPFHLGHCLCGTSRCDNGSRQIEDFLAIPDMIAGALAEQMQLRSSDPADLSGVFFMYRGEFSDKTRQLTWWLSDSRKQLKRLLCIIDPASDGKGNLISWFHFYDQKEEPMKSL